MFKVYEHSVYVGNFTPDERDFLHVCQHAGKWTGDLEFRSKSPTCVNDNIRKLKIGEAFGQVPSVRAGNHHIKLFSAG
jgi:hypothetical protein